MAISREQVEEAVERYLPRTANYAYSEDLINQDLDAIFARVQQIVLTNLLIDPDAIFYIIFLSSRRMLAQIDSVIVQLNALDSTDQLRGITGDDPQRVEDFTQLRAAQAALVRLSTGLVADNTFGDDALASFRSSIESFMTDQLVPNVAGGGNRVKIVADIRATMESLKGSWAVVLERRENVFALLDKFVEEDLRTRVSSIIISSVQTLLRDLERTLPTQTTEQQAEAAEETLAELAAAEAALIVVGSAPDPLGEVIVPPAYDGSTTASYLVVSGLGRTEPLSPILTGDKGQLLLTGPNGGAPFTSWLGRTVTPGVGTVSDRITDSSIPNFELEGIEPGMYITFPDIVVTANITAVTATNIVFSPGLRDRPLEDLRYAVTDHVPGEYFTDLDTAFGSLYENDGSSASTFVDGAADGGSFVRVDKISGSDGTNIKASGSTGEFLANKAEGTTGGGGELDVGGGFSHISDATATFLSDGVEVGDEVTLGAGPNAAGSPYTISQVLSETLLEVSSTLVNSGGNAYYVHKVDGDIYFADSNATFFSDRVGEALGDHFFSDSTQVPNDQIENAISQTELQFFTAAPYTRETGITWQVVDETNRVLFSDSINFTAYGVLPGDLVDIAGDVRTIVEVDGNRLELADPIDGNPALGLSFVVYAAIEDAVMTRFEKTNGLDFDAQGADTYMTVQEYRSGAVVDVDVPTVLRIDGVDYSIAKLADDDPANALFIAPLREGLGDFTDPLTFADENADFVTAGVDPAKHRLVIRYGVNAEQAFDILTVDSETQLTLNNPGVAAVGENYEILPKEATNVSWSYFTGLTTRHVFDLALNNSFQPGLEGAGYVFRPGETNEVVTNIDTIISPNEAWLSAPVPQGWNTYTYSISTPVLPGMTLVSESRTYTIREIVDVNTIRISPKFFMSPGKDLVWQVLSSGDGLYGARIYDEDGAALYDAVEGFKDDLFQFRVELESDRPVNAQFLQPFDPGGDGFAEAFEVSVNVKLGYANVPYRILSAFQNQSNLFYGAEPVTLPATDDVLSIWGLLDPYIIDAAVSIPPNMELTLRSPTQARLENVGYAVVRGGSDYHGKYLLFDDQNNALGLDETTDLLRLKVAEVLIDYGTIIIALDDDGGAADGEVVEDGDEDGFSSLFTAPSASFTSIVNRGDRLAVTYGADVVVTYVDYAVTDTQLRVTPPLPEGAGLAWELGRNSVSSALQEVDNLRAQMQDLKTLVEAYVVPRDLVVDGILNLLKEQRLDRAIDLLYDGNFDTFVDLTAATASYTSRARSAVQGVGASINYNPDFQGASGRGIRQRITGVDPATGKPSANNTRSTSSHSKANFRDELNTRLQLAEGIADLVDDEYMRGMLFATDEEQRNRAIYALVGTVYGGFVADDDPTLPWIANTGSRLTRLQRRYNKLAAALNYMIEHPEEFCDIDVTLEEEPPQFEVPE